MPDELRVELKSLKLYLWTYRDQGAFHEKVTNGILDDLAALLDPRYLEIDAKWYVRGGITTWVTASHIDENWGSKD